MTPPVPWLSWKAISLFSRSWAMIIICRGHDEGISFYPCWVDFNMTLKNLLSLKNTSAAGQIITILPPLHRWWGRNSGLWRSCGSANAALWWLPLTPEIDETVVSKSSCNVTWVRSCSGGLKCPLTSELCGSFWAEPCGQVYHVMVIPVRSTAFLQRDKLHPVPGCGSMWPACDS